MSSEPTQFKKGHNRKGPPFGNQNNRKATIWTHALKRALERLAAKAGEEKLVDRGLDKIADTVVALAVAGDETAYLEIGNRMEGKSKEHVQLDVIQRDAREMSDEELADIARGGGDGAADEAQGADLDPSVH